MKHTENWGYEVFTQYEEDRFNTLSKRSLLGAGTRYTLTQQQDQKQANHFGAGLFYEEEQYSRPLNLEAETTVRLNLYWAFRKKLAENLRYTSTLYFQPKAEDLQDQKGIWQNSLTISVTSTINLSLTWDIEHDTKTPTNADSTSTNYNSVLIYNF
jgi:putative salt-induced outer membrane protein YdiY